MPCSEEVLQYARTMTMTIEVTATTTRLVGALAKIRVVICVITDVLYYATRMRMLVFKCYRIGF